MRDVAAERAVLASIFQHGHSAYIDVVDLLKPSDFSLEFNQFLFSCFTHLFAESDKVQIDVPLIMSTANSLGYGEILNTQQNIEHIRSLMNFPAELSNVRGLATKIKKLEFAQSLLVELQKIEGTIEQVTGEEPVDEILGLAERPIFDFASRYMDGFTRRIELLGEGIREHMQHIEENPVEIIGIPTGFAQYDLAIGGGLRRKTVNVIGARPKTGKTVFLDNTALHIAGNLGIPCLNLDTEMSKTDHIYRMLANLSGVSINEIESGKYIQDPVKRRAVTQAIEKIEKIPYHYISVAGLGFDEMVSEMRRWIFQHVGFNEAGEANDCVILYDYLKLMNADGISGKNIQEYQLLGYQISALHNFTVKYSVPCLAFIQLNREGIDGESTGVASGSDRIIWLCSNFTIFKPKKDEEIAEDAEHQDKKIEYNRKLVPIVARHGGGLEDGDYINIKFDKHLAKLTEGPTRNELYKLSGGKQGGCKKPSTKNKKQNDADEPDNDFHFKF